MHFRDTLTAYAKGDSLHLFWRLFRLQQNAHNKFIRKLLLFLCFRCAHRHGGYIGADAVIKSRPSPRTARRLYFPICENRGKLPYLSKCDRRRST